MGGGGYLSKQFLKEVSGEVCTLLSIHLWHIWTKYQKLVLNIKIDCISQADSKSPRGFVFFKNPMEYDQALSLHKIPL